MTIKTECPWCKQVYYVEETLAGQNVQCTTCQKIFPVKNMAEPNQAGSPVQPPPPPPPPAKTEYANPTAPVPAEPRKSTGFGTILYRILMVLFLLVISACCVVVAAVLTEKTVYFYETRFVSVNGSSASGVSSRLEDESEELVAAIPLIDTYQKNYGSSEYVTGLRPHTRTEAVVLVIRHTRKVRFYQPGYWKKSSEME